MGGSPDGVETTGLQGTPASPKAAPPEPPLIRCGQTYDNKKHAGACLSPCSCSGSQSRHQILLVSFNPTRN